MPTHTPLVSTGSSTNARNDNPYEVLLYYKFVHVPRPELVRNEQEFLCKRLSLLGRILISEEGINGTLSGKPEATRTYRAFMDKHPLFAHTEFKVDPAEEHAFGRLAVRVKRELVNLGTPEIIGPAQGGAPYIEPHELQALLRNKPDDVVLLDTRSKFEYDVGHFKDARPLEIDYFRELPDMLEDLSEYKDKHVVTYCTGGIRCEKLTPLMLRMGFKKVSQLHGGIIRYAHETGGENFDGQCYVFDRRLTVPVNTVNPTVVGKCSHCGEPSEHFINCANADCNDHVILCENCCEVLDGCCKEDCMHTPRQRVWNGTGQYWRGEGGKDFVQQPTPHAAPGV